MSILIFTLVIALVLYMFLSYKVYMDVLHPNTSSHSSSMEFDVSQGSYDLAFVENLEKEVVKIPSSMGYDLYAYWMPLEASKKTVVFVHGVTSTIFGALKYYDLYRSLGFNILAYDHRNHGLSGGSETTFGYHEKVDLETCIQWVRKKMGEDTIVGTHGESMGAATALQHIGVYNNLDFVVADCPYADLTRELTDVIKREQTLPLYIGLPGASLISKIRGNGFYGEISPIKMIKDVETPICIIHGEIDAYITPDHAKDLYEANRVGYKQLYFAKEADHALAIIKDRENYSKEIRKFFAAISIEV